MIVAGKAWCQKSNGKHKKLHHFSNRAMHLSHKRKTVTFLSISELVLFYLSTAVILISIEWNAIHA